jgi:hypothetical protein
MGGGGMERLFRAWRGEEDDTGSEEDDESDEEEERAGREALRFLDGYSERFYERDAGVRRKWFLNLLMERGGILLY